MLSLDRVSRPPLPSRFCFSTSLLAAALAVASGSHLAAGAGRFTVAAPDGGTVVVLAVDPDDPSILYSGSRSAGVFRSYNGGKTWQPAGKGMSGEWVTALAVAPSDPRVLYAGVTGRHLGVFRSADRGTSWLPVGGGQSLGAWGLAVHPTDPDLVIVADGDRVWKTIDGGSSWIEVTPPSQPGLSFTYRIAVFDPAHPSTLYVGTNGGIAKTTDLGETWTRAQTDAFVLALVIDPLHPQTLWAGIEGGVLRSDDGGASWSFLSLPVDRYDVVTALALDPADPHVVYAAAGSSELEETIFRSDDGGSTWKPLFETAGVLALAADPHHPGTLWAGLRSLGVLKSIDGGQTWSISRQGLKATGITALAADPQRSGTLLAGLDDGPTSLALSEDDGKTWTPVEVDLGPVRGIARTDALVLDPFHPDRLYGIFWGLLRWSPDFGRTWRPLPGYPPFPVISLALAGAPERLVAATHETIPCDLGFGCPPRTVLHLFHSTDGGSTWQEVLPPRDSLGAVLTVAPSDPNVVYLATDGLFASSDGGATWRQVEISPAQLPIFDLAVHPLDPHVLYAGTRLRAGGVLRSVDGGTTWQPPRAGLPRGEYVSQAVLDVLVDPQDPERVYAAADLGVFQSLDGGDTWSPFSEGLGSVPVRVLALDTRGPGTLYAGGSSGGGLFARTRGAEGCPEGPTALCLVSGRFRARVTWQDFDGAQGTGRVAPWLDDSGGFWFFDPKSLEVVVKVVDGRPSNGHFWIFVSSLSNVAFELTVVDTTSGAVWTYANPLGRFASFADVMAF